MTAVMNTISDEIDAGNINIKVNTLRTLAKTIKHETPLSLKESLNALAETFGFQDWQDLVEHHDEFKKTVRVKSYEGWQSRLNDIIVAKATN